MQQKHEKIFFFLKNRFQYLKKKRKPLFLGKKKRVNVVFLVRFFFLVIRCYAIGKLETLGFVFFFRLIK